MTGRLIAVVGPSGVGKDSVMAGIAAARPDMHLLRRVITRPTEAGGEPHHPVDTATFEALRARGAFCLSWGAHGLFYGIPTEVSARLEAGQDCLVNLSRGVLREAADQFETLTVLHITARPETLAKRLAGRGRETAEDIAKRLTQAAKPLPAEIAAHEIANDGALAEAVTAALSALQPVRA